MTEPSRKLFAYGSSCRDPVAGGAIKQHKRSYFCGAKVTMTLSSVGDDVVDTLAVLKKVYLAFRVERPQVHFSEDVVVFLTPGVTGDNHINETPHGSH